MNRTNLLDVLIQNQGSVIDVTFDQILILDFSSLGNDVKELGVIQFENCTFNRNLILSNLAFELDFLSFENCKFNSDNVILTNIHKIYDLTFSNCKLENLTILSSEIEDCQITNCSINTSRTSVTHWASHTISTCTTGITA